MSSRPIQARREGSVAAGFRHEAFLYSGVDEFCREAVGFIGDALESGERVLVATDPRKLAALRSELGRAAGMVLFADMAQIGGNPARIIPVWRDFVARATAEGRAARGIGEPAWAGRSDAELSECEQHETLLNLAFITSPGFWLLCPYDTASLPRPVLDAAASTHPFLVRGSDRRPSARYRGYESALAGPALPEPPPGHDRLVFGEGPLQTVRRFVARHAAACGLGDPATADLTMAVNEIATNSVRHGGGRGVLRAWTDGPALVCEVSDAGLIAEPLVGRRPPAAEREGGRGVWLANQLCDLVQIRSSDSGTTVRLHMSSRR